MHTTSHGKKKWVGQLATEKILAVENCCKIFLTKNFRQK